MNKLEMATIVRALESVRGGPVLTSNQCHDLAMAINVQLAAPTAQAVDEEAERAEFERVVYGDRLKGHAILKWDANRGEYACQTPRVEFSVWLKRAAIAAPVQSEPVTGEMCRAAAREMLRLGYGQHENHAESILRAALDAAPVRAVRLPEREMLEAAYRAGFSASGEGWNAEYPGDADERPSFIERMESELGELAKINAQPEK